MIIFIHLLNKILLFNVRSKIYFLVILNKYIEIVKECFNGNIVSREIKKTSALKQLFVAIVDVIFKGGSK